MSVIVPVFNAEAHLQEAIESVLGQDLGDVEIVCIDDASTDASREVLDRLRKADRRVKTLLSSRNLGPAASRNIGLREARGSHVQFMDADDILEPGALSALLARATATSAQIVGGGITLFDDSQGGRTVEHRMWEDRSDLRFGDEPGLWIPWWFVSFLFSRRFLLENDIRFPPLRAGEDPVFLAHALTVASRIELMDVPVYRYRKYPKPTGSGARSASVIRDWICHALLVKGMFESCQPAAWSHAYGPFAHNNMALWLRDVVELGAQDPNARDAEQELRRVAGCVWDEALEPGTADESMVWPQSWLRRRGLIGR